MERRCYTLWATIRHAEDVPGEWVAHILDLDIVTQGRSVEHAIHMAHEAAELVVLEDLDQRRDPLVRGTTSPEECWNELWAIRGRGRPVESMAALEASMSSRAGSVCVAQLFVGVERRVPSVEGAPMAWLDTSRNDRSSALPCS